MSKERREPEAALDAAFARFERDVRRLALDLVRIEIDRLRTVALAAPGARTPAAAPGALVASAAASRSVMVGAASAPARPRASATPAPSSTVLPRRAPATTKPGRVYSETFKKKLVERMLMPNPRPTIALARETGVTEATLYRWRNEAAKPPHTSTPEEKLAVVLEAAAVPEAELGAFLRRRGVPEAQLVDVGVAVARLEDDGDD
jgi:transposase-like protein